MKCTTGQKSGLSLDPFPEERIDEPVFTVFERIHDLLHLTDLHYADLHYAVLHNEGILPNRVAVGERAICRIHKLPVRRVPRLVGKSGIATCFAHEKEAS